MSKHDLQRKNVQVLSEMLRDMRRVGFRQLRATTHGMLYGFKEHRFIIPRGVSTVIEVWRIDKLQKDWEGLKKVVLAEYPGIKLTTGFIRGLDSDHPEDVGIMKPIEDPEELLRVDAVGTGSAPAMGVAAGSSPAVSTTTVGVAGASPDAANVATGGSTPLAHPNTPSTEENGDMTRTKAGKKRPTLRGCPVAGCHGKAGGRHVWAHRKKGEWKKEYDEQTRAAKNQSQRDRHTKGKSSGNGHERQPAASVTLRVTTPENGASAKVAKGGPKSGTAMLAAAFEEIKTAVRHIEYERDHYKQQYEEIAEEHAKMATVLSSFTSFSKKKVPIHKT